MSRRDRHGVVTALAVASAVVVPGAVAHVAAGGALAVLPAGLALLAAAAVAATAGRVRLRWTFPRVASVALAAQPALHRVFAAGGGAHPHDVLPVGGQPGHQAHSAHQHVDQALSAAAGSARHGTWMALAHVAVAFGVAAGLRWGVRWLRSMPTLARALVFPRRWAVAPFVGRAWFVAAPPDARPRHLATLSALGNRGPPR